jgi:hypothetical protein
MNKTSKKNNKDSQEEIFKFVFEFDEEDKNVLIKRKLLSDTLNYLNEVFEKIDNKEIVYE